MRFNITTQRQMFLLFYGGHGCVLRGAQTWRLHTNLYKSGQNTPQNKSRLKNSRDLILCEVVYIFNIYHIPYS